mgnify:CR=1 FL=1
MCLLKPGISDTADQSLRQFTFHYVSIKTKIPAPVYFVLYKFTFHHVSIKTGIRPAIVIQNAVFTFHYVSIKTTITALSVVMLQNSHSTMYLLKRINNEHPRISDIIHIPPCICLLYTSDAADEL